MSSANPEAAAILATAQQRGRQKNLPYAGEVTPAEAHRLFAEFGATIVDVRSAIEHEYIGRIPGSTLISWKQFPSGEMNAHFLPQLQERVPAGNVVLFLCRSGVRSHSAATVAAQAGYADAYNIVEGFEGDLNQQQRRGDTGWRKAGLPWIQS